MAKAVRAFHTGQTWWSGSTLLNGYKLFQYEAGTSTKANTYTDSGKGTANSNPMTLDSDGRLGQDVYIDQSMKFTLAASSAGDPPSSSVWEVDNWLSTEQLWTTLAKSVDYTIVEGDRDKLVIVDASGAARTITLLAAATAGDGFMLAVKKIDSSANTVTIDANASETIDDNLTYVLKNINDGILLISDGTTWHILKSPNLLTLTDANGNEVLELVGVASAVNYFKMTNAATGNPPLLGVESEADIGMTLNDSNDNELVILSATASAVNEVTITNSATGVGPTIESSGETNVPITIKGKGTGDITIGQATDQDTTIEAEDARTATVDYPLIVKSTTTGTPAAGIGVGIECKAQSADEDPSDFGRLNFVSDDIGAGTEDTYFAVQTRVGGSALADSYKWKNTGAGNYLYTGAPTAERTITLPDTDIDNHIVQIVTSSPSTESTTTSQIPHDDSIPQSSEGAEYATLAITPKSTANKLVIDFVSYCDLSGAGFVTIALFQDAAANAIQATQQTIAASSQPNVVVIRHIMTAGTTSATTFKIRYGPGSGLTASLNRGQGAFFYGAADTATFTITEYSV